jgi:putative glutamine amidotransferase
MARPNERTGRTCPLCAVQHMKAALLFRKTERELPYREALARVGIEAVAFNPGSSESLDAVGGILMTGGTDVDPSLYGERPQPETEVPDRERDDYESAVLREAIARGMPVLAICRGMQLMNVVYGGTLLQHIENHVKTVHEVDLRPPFTSIFGADRITVNSRHHQAVGRVGEGLEVTARDPADGVIEGVALPGARFVAGVEWHPEDLIDDPVQLRLFEAFRNAFCASRLH